ncbi:MAG TPA: carboxypeptidase regulatory-like domain-containing protein [Blastocatellia bacterium]|nr:carboxypeptidase regulatory-like domain-containing protein [Blastocatellia bacterium]
MRALIKLFAIVIIALPGTIPVLAQYTGQQISGFVKDSNNAVIANATVTLRNPGTGQTRTATTNESGYYVIANIPIGNYEVSVEMAGFKKFSKSGVEVTVGSKPSVDAILEVGDARELVTVTADAATVESSTGEVGRLITGEQANNLQLNGRNFTQLLALVPGVSTNYRSPTDLLGGFGANQGQLNVNGGRRGAQSWNIDGADNKDNGGSGNNFVNINPDALAEFKVLTSNYSAEYGQSAGAVVNMALKSGTREFHGVGYEYLRNDAFDARAFNSLAKQKLRFNNFGGNIGGPIYIPGKFNQDRDKLFFFFATDFKRLRQVTPTTVLVPTLAQRNNLPAGFSPNAKRLIDIYPLPNYVGDGGNYQYGLSTPINVNQYITKIDYNMNSRHQFAVHYARDAFYALQNPSATAINLMIFDRDIPGENTSAKWTWIPSSTLVNTVQVVTSGNVVQQHNFRPNPLFINDVTRAANGVTYPMVFGVSNIIPTVNIGGGIATLNVRPIEFQNFNRVFQFKDDLSKIVGSHSLKFGAVFMRSRKNQDNQPNINGSFTFTSLTAALLGNFTTYNEGGRGREGWFRFSQFEAYGQDNWKINRRLSIDYGLRYYYMGPQYAALNNGTIFVPSLYDPARAPQVSRDSIGQIISAPGTYDPVNGLALAGSSFPDAAQGRIANLNDPLLKSLFRGLPDRLLNASNLIAPRFSFAFDLLGNQTTILRGGYGMTYERIQGNLIFGAINNPPFVRDVTLSGSGATTGPVAGNVENPGGGANRVLPQNVSTSFDPGLEIPTVQNWSLGVQRKITNDSTLDVSYVGSNGYHQTINLRLNQLRAGTLQANPGVTANALRPYRGYGDINQVVAGSTFNYHSLQVLFRKTIARSGIINVSYTWSKAIADVSDWNTIPVNSYDLSYDRGLTTYDRPHMFVASYVYPLPFWQRGGAWYKKALGGWELSGITTIQSGRPINITISQDLAGIGTSGSQRPNLIGNPNIPAGERTTARWFNTAAFALPAERTFGTLGFDAIRGPGYQNWDISLKKSIPIKERLKTEFRFEMYNALNHVNFWTVGNVVGSRTFGQVTQATDPRILQMALRIQF